MKAATVANTGRAGRRNFLKLTGSAGAFYALGRAPVFAQTAPKKLIFAHITAPPESASTAFAWMAKEITARTNGELDVQFHGGTLLNKEMDIINAVKAGNVAIGSPAGAAATAFPELGVFLVPYLISNYDGAYLLFNGAVGDKLDAIFQQKYQLKILNFWDYGFRHFWNSKRPIAEPKDLTGLKIRVQPAKVFADTINGLGGNAVPMPWGEVIPAAQQRVIDGGDMGVYNILVLRVYEVSTYCSLTYHSYGPSVTVMNMGNWSALTPAQQKLVLEISREAQRQIREATEKADNVQQARQLLEPKGMKINEASVENFKKVAQEKIWPGYQAQYGELWDTIIRGQKA